MTIKKQPEQLLYLVYGGKDVYRREAKFSILSALARCKTPEDLVIRVLTDSPGDFAGWPVDTVPLSDSVLQEWQGVHGYYHRRKACAIASGLELAEKTLFVDTDTLFLVDPVPLIRRIQPEHYWVDEFEFSWDEVKGRPQFQTLARHLQASHARTPVGWRLFNSGVCGLMCSDVGLMNESIKLIDSWSAHVKDLHTLEQIALSWVMHGKAIGQTRREIYHYYSDKKFFHAMHGVFFGQHGENYRQELPILSKDVPIYKCVPGFLSRARVKFDLMRTPAPLRKMGRDLLYGGALPATRYADACRAVWWEKGLRELYVMQHSTDQDGWPAGLPKPLCAKTGKQWRECSQQYLAQVGSSVVFHK